MITQNNFKLICFVCLFLMFCFSGFADTKNTTEETNALMCPDAITANVNDSLQLINLFNALGGPSWDIEYQWDLTQCVSEWYGICLNDNGKVKRIRLWTIGSPDGFNDCDDIPQLVDGVEFSDAIGIVGTLPVDLTLEELEIFELRGADLNGTNMPNYNNINFPILSEILFIDNNLGGDIPNLQLPQLRGLRLQGNSFTTSPNFAGCPMLEFLNLTENTLTGDFPNNANMQDNLIGAYYRRNNFTGITPFYQNSLFLVVAENTLTFEDLLPNHADNSSGLGGNYDYDNQNIVAVPSELNEITLPLGFPAEISIGIDPEVISNLYTWYKETDIFQTSNENVLVLDAVSVEDEGSYHAEITNSIITDLTLTTNDIVITTCLPGVREEQVYLCNGESYTVSESGATFNAEKPSGFTTLPMTAVNGCDSIVAVELFFPPIITLRQDTILCSDGIDLQVNLAGNWTTAGSSNIVNPTASMTSAESLDEGDNIFTFINGDENFSSCPLIDISSSFNAFYDRPPVAIGEAFLTNQGERLEENYRDNDEFDIDTDEFSIIEEVQNGIFNWFDDGTFIYAPDENFFGMDSVVYQICSDNCETQDCSIATINFRVKIALGQDVVITPNNDGFNDIFIIAALSDEPSAYRNNDLVIVSQWDRPVFKTSNYENDWTGTNQTGEPLPEATYYYIFSSQTLSEPISGKVTILR